MSTVIVELEEGAIGVSVPDVSVDVSVPVSVVQVETSGPPGPPGPPSTVPGPPGPPGLNPLGAWSPATAYVPDDLVTSAGSTWLALLPSQGVDPGADASGSPVGSWAGPIQSLGSNPYTCAVNFTVPADVHVVAMNVAASFGGAAVAERIGLASALNVPGVGVQWLGWGTADAAGKVVLDNTAVLRAGTEYWYVVYKPATSNIMITAGATVAATSMVWGGRFMYGLPEPVSDLGLYVMPVILHGTGANHPWTLFAAGGEDGQDGQDGADGVSPALPPETDANRNTGYGAGTPAAFNAGAFDNTGVGQGVLGLITTGDRNTGAGSGALAALTTGSNNTVLGYQAGAKLTTGNSNFALGPYALDKATTASDTVAIGYQALRNIVDVNGGVGIGSYVLNLATGGPNVAVGGSAMANLSTAYYNTAIGTSAFAALTTGRYNTAVGYLTGGYGVNMGTQEFTVLVGAHSSAYAAGSGNALTAVGFQSKAHTGATALGSYAEARGISSTALGSYAVATLDNQIMLGTASQRVDVPGEFYVKGSQVWKSWTGTQAAYDAIGSKDPMTLYCVV